MTQTAIEATGKITCHKCGVDHVLAMGDDMECARCVCGEILRYRHRHPSPLSALEVCGYKLSVDYDGALLVDSPGDLPEELREWLFACQCELRGVIEYVGKAARACFVGGTKAGQRHRQGIGHRYGALDTPVCVHIGRAHWETYKFHGRDDPRLFYVGRSTSKAKAKQGCFVKP